MSLRLLCLIFVRLCTWLRTVALSGYVITAPQILLPPITLRPSRGNKRRLIEVKRPRACADEILLSEDHGIA
jgi:hypothetical protein